MDILYYIGKGSHHNNQELRYSLRALEKHCKDIGNVWIVGNRPHFLNNNIKYLWVEDSGQWWQNAYRKTMAAIDADYEEVAEKVMKKYYAQMTPREFVLGMLSRGVTREQIEELIANNQQVWAELNYATYIERKNPLLD